MLGNFDSYMASPFEKSVGSPFRSRLYSFQKWTFVHENSGYTQLIDIGAIIMFGIGNRRLQNFLDQLGRFLFAEGQKINSLGHIQASNLICHQSAFLRGYAGVV